MNSDNPRGRLAGVLAFAALLCASVTEQESSPVTGAAESGQLPTPGK
ncbi:hypothetical protein [Corynebacterium sp.]|nr:hypothetical protein [Corynebacterium sp.]HHU66973.1 hypothetical protein [Corynebacterium sp.]